MASSVERTFKEVRGQPSTFNKGFFLDAIFSMPYANLDLDLPTSSPLDRLRHRLESSQLQAASQLSAVSS